MSEHDKISTPACALMMLIWQEPTDRALVGWCPYPSMRPNNWGDDARRRWLAEQVAIPGYQWVPNVVS